MSSLGLSEELLSVKSYLSDARVLVDEQFGKSVVLDEYHCYIKNVIEVARMLQIERTHKKTKVRPESAPEKEKPTNPKRASSDKLMSRVRANPKLPPMVFEPPVKRSSSSRSSKVPVEKVRPSRSRKSDSKPRRIPDSTKPRRK